MHNNNNIIFLIFLLIFSFKIFSQTYSDDSLAVRSILDANGLYTLSVENVSDSSGGRIVELSLIKKNINIIPSEIGNLTALKILNLCNNYLTVLPPEIGNLNELTELYLSRNNLNLLPPEIGSLSDLIILSIGDNNLTSLTPEIGNLSELKELYLGNNNGNNNITFLPSEIGNLRHNIFQIVGGFDILPRCTPGSAWFGNFATITPDCVLYDSRFIKSTVVHEIGHLLGLWPQLFNHIDNDKENHPDWNNKENCIMSYYHAYEYEEYFLTWYTEFCIDCIGVIRNAEDPVFN